MATVFARQAIPLPRDVQTSSVAVLTSGGLASAVLLSQALDHFKVVYPVFGRFGLPWEEAKEQALRRLLAAIRGPQLGRLKTIDLPCEGIYDEDGTISARLVPESSGPQESLRLADRHVLLISKAAVWSAVNGIEVFAIGPISERGSFEDNASFMSQLESVVRAGLGHEITVLHPFRGYSLAKVIEIGRGLPLEFTFSCIRPTNEEGTWVHCGRCHKCVDRQKAFAQAGVPDRTRYADEPNDALALTND